MSRNNIILGLSEPEFLDNFRLMGIENFMLSCVEYGKKFYNLEAWTNNASLGISAKLLNSCMLLHEITGLLVS